MLVTACGIIVADIIAAGLPYVPKPGRDLFLDSARRIDLHLGGHASNVSVDLCKLGLGGTEVSLIGSIGDDIFGDFVERELGKLGIVANLDRIKRVGTSKSVVFDVKGEDRRLVHGVGANWYLDPQKVIRTLRTDVPAVFYVGAPGMLGEFDFKLPKILKLAKALGCTTFVDAVIPYKRPSDLVVPALRWTDIFHSNNIEAMEIAGERSVSNAVKNLAKHGTKLVIVTSGSAGGTAFTRNFSLNFPSFRVKVVDPLGAGDAFCAGVIIKLLQWQRKHTPHERPTFFEDMSVDQLTDMMVYGAAAGAASCLAEGTTTSVTRRNVRQLLDKQYAGFRKNVRLTKRSLSPINGKGNMLSASSHAKMKGIKHLE
ncbi:MAG: carbohydrate kinase family protein [Candidatus Bathyarchaeia archaeon]|jgi:sugar/nucleoside kinase (ribokinase family)